MQLSSGKVWPHVARLSRIQVIGSDHRNRLLAETCCPEGAEGTEGRKTEKRREKEREWIEQKRELMCEGRRRVDKERRQGMGRSLAWRQG